MSQTITPQEYIKKHLRQAYGQTEESEGTSGNDTLFEGTKDTVITDRYERNRAARQACLEVHGTACAICGFDFAKAYGPTFAGIIQVHHVVPLHQLGEEHTVDPVNDLIPVCPNCHFALHSKPGGTYTPDELRHVLECNR